MTNITINTDISQSLQPIILNYKSQTDLTMSLESGSTPLTGLDSQYYYFAIDNDYNFATQPIYEAYNSSFTTTELSAGQIILHMDLDTPSLSAFIGETEQRDAICCLWYSTSAGNTLLLHNPITLLNISVDK